MKQTNKCKGLPSVDILVLSSATKKKTVSKQVILWLNEQGGNF